jgi:hypothetical protein
MKPSEESTKGDAGRHKKSEGISALASDKENKGKNNQLHQQ